MKHTASRRPPFVRCRAATLVAFLLAACGAEDPGPESEVSAVTPNGGAGGLVPPPLTSGGSGGASPIGGGTGTPPVGGSGGTPPPTGPSYATTVEPFFAVKCTESCHEQGGLLGGPGGIDEVKMDLAPGLGYATLTAGASVQVPSMRIVGTGLEDSYLWHKLQDTFLAVGGIGAKMPVTGELTPEELLAVQGWIEGGAAP